MSRSRNLCSRCHCRCVYEMYYKYISVRLLFPLWSIFEHWGITELRTLYSSSCAIIPWRSSWGRAGRLSFFFVLLLRIVLTGKNKMKGFPKIPGNLMICLKVITFLQLEQEKYITGYYGIHLIATIYYSWNLLWLRDSWIGDKRHRVIYEIWNFLLFNFLLSVLYAVEWYDEQSVLIDRYSI